MALYLDKPLELKEKLKNDIDFIINGNEITAGIVLGDVNNDNSVEVNDAAMVLQYVLGEIKLSEKQLRAAAIYGSPENITALDAAAILKKALEPDNFILS